MASFGIASQVLQIVPASTKAAIPDTSNAREADENFLDHLGQVMERREEALEKATVRAEAREAADTQDEAPRGESISEATPNREKRKDDATSDPAHGSDSDPVAEGDKVTGESAEAEGNAAPDGDEKQSSQTPDDSNNEEAGESVAADTTTTDGDANRIDTAKPDAVPMVSPADGELVVAAAGASAESAGVVAAPNTGRETANQKTTVSGNAGDASKAAAALAEVSNAPATVLPTEHAADDTALDAPVQPVLTADAPAQPSAGAGDETLAKIGATLTQGDALASAAAGVMSDAGKSNGKPQERAAKTTQTEGPKVVLTPNSGTEVKRPTDSGAVQVASADGEEPETASATTSKGFTPTTVPGKQQANGQAAQSAQPARPDQTGLQNAVASVVDAQGSDSNSALKLAALANGTSPSQSGEAGAPKAGPNPAAGGQQFQPAANGVANTQALQNASGQVTPLRATPTPTPPPNPAAFQVAIHVARALDNGLEQIKIRLHPADLGRVEVKLDVGQDGRVTATVIADKSDTLDMLQRDSRALEKALQDAGLQTDSESLNFGLRGEEGRDEANKSDEGDHHADGRNGDALDEMDLHGAIPPSRPLTAQAGALDIFV